MDNGETLKPPTREQIERAHRKAAEDREFWEPRLEECRAAYPDQYVAASRATGEVVVVASDVFSLFDTLRSKQIDPKSVRMRYIVGGLRHYALSSTAGFGQVSESRAQTRYGSTRGMPGTQS